MDDFSHAESGSELFCAMHDGIVQHPLGGGSYIFDNGLATPSLRYLGLLPPVKLRKSDVSRKHADSNAKSSPSATSGMHSNLIIHIGAQPNNSPHVGTIMVFALAFVLGRVLKREYDSLRHAAQTASTSTSTTAGWVDSFQVTVQLDLVDTAPDKAHDHPGDNGVKYQKSQRITGAMEKFLPDYEQLCRELAELVDHEVDYKTERQTTLTSMPGVGTVMRAIVEDRDRITLELAPEREALPVRAACPVEGCGLADKHGIKNEYDVAPDRTTITFHCPDHGAHSVQLENEEEVKRLEFNTPLRNLVRSLVYMIDTQHSRTDAQAVPSRIHMRVTGADYAGTYQEQLFYRQLFNLSHVEGLDFKDAITFPFVVYAPLIVDWAGSKLSKSLYLTGGDDAYRYLKDTGRDYLVSFDQMKKMGKDWRVLFKLMEEWVASPKKLFRPYSVEYIHLVFQKAEGTIVEAGEKDIACPGDS